MDHLWTPWRYAYVTGEDSKRSRRGVPTELDAWPGETGCVFCNMLAAVDYAVKHGMSAGQAERAAWILHRGPSCFLVLNAFPYNGGHLMALPYQHVSRLGELPDETYAELMGLVRRVERVLTAVYNPDGLNFGLNLGQAAGAGVADHLHFHAVPRWTGDSNFMSVIGETRILPEMLAESWKRIRAELDKETSASQK